MSGTMSSADLVADLKASLHDAAGVFTAANDADFVRHLKVAAVDLGSRRPLVKSGTLTLVADTDSYDAPADLATFIAERWSAGRMPQPWESTWPGAAPRQSITGSGATRKIVFTPAPTVAQISVLGSSFAYDYRAAHSIGTAAADTTVAEADRGLLILRAQAEAMREVAIRNAHKPVQLRDGLSGTPRNGTPAALYQSLLTEFREAA